jgi:hypothetical protein
MQFMLLLKGDVPIDADTKAPQVSFDPSELVNAMHKFNAEMAEAGILLAAEGLDPSAYGARVVYRNGQRTVVDGPFAEAKELVAGFYLIDVKSQAEAIEWAARCPVHYAATGPDDEAIVEVRRIGTVQDTYPDLAEG